NTLLLISLFLFHTPSTTDIYTLSLHDALPISAETPKLGCPVQAEGPSTKVDGPLHRSKFSFSVLRGVNHRDIRINLHRLAIENRSEEHTSELQSRFDLVCRLLLEKKKNKKIRR